MLRHVAVAEMSRVSILALLLYCNSGPSFVSPSRVRLMHCTLRFSVIQKKSLSLDPQGALMVALLQNRWQQPFIKGQWLLSLVNRGAIIAQTHAQPNPHISVKSYMCPQTNCLIHSYGLCTLKHKHIHILERERETQTVEARWVCMCVCMMGAVSRHPQLLSLHSSSWSSIQRFLLISQRATQLIRPETTPAHFVCLTQ